MTPDELSDRLLEFAARLGKLIDALPDTRLGRHVSGQLTQCGTAAGPNYEEACGAESRSNFIHKMRICLKELRESRSWIRLILKAEMLPGAQVNSLNDECSQLCSIVGQSVATATSNKGARR